MALYKFRIIIIIINYKYNYNSVTLFVVIPLSPITGQLMLMIVIVKLHSDFKK